MNLDTAIKQLIEDEIFEQLKETTVNCYSGAIEAVVEFAINNKDRVYESNKIIKDENE